jgi:Zinc dependent phospholipase C
MRNFSCRLLSVVLISLPLVQPAHAYSVLTHEALIDRNWDPNIKPLLLARFHDVTPDQLKEARGYAYGGAIIQDMGYYPFGSKFFSNLAHYTRSGDFVMTLLRDAQDLNEYAFALGALAHYAADTEGHPVAVNRAVPLLYPKLRAKLGSNITYEDDPTAHLKTEFAFDIVEVARGKYASESYHDFIGFKVAKPLLERAFADTYSIELKDQFHNLDLALGTYRWTVAQVIPELTATAWSTKKADIQKLQAGMTRSKFVYRLNTASYRKEWNEQYQKPGLGARFLAFVFRIIPKVGPFKALGFKVPTAATEKLFEASFDDTMKRYQALLVEVKQNRLQLANDNFDTGKPTKLGEYRMADDTYAELLEKLGKSKSVIAPELRANILQFYGNSEAPEKARAELQTLRSQN